MDTEVVNWVGSRTLRRGETEGQALVLLTWPGVTQASIQGHSLLNWLRHEPDKKSGAESKSLARESHTSVGAGVGFCASSCVISSLISDRLSLLAFRPRSVPYSESSRMLCTHSIKWILQQVLPDFREPVPHVPPLQKLIGPQ